MRRNLGQRVLPKRVHWLSCPDPHPWYTACCGYIYIFPFRHPKTARWCINFVHFRGVKAPSLSATGTHDYLLGERIARTISKGRDASKYAKQPRRSSRIGLYRSYFRDHNIKSFGQRVNCVCCAVYSNALHSNTFFMMENEYGKHYAQAMSMLDFRPFCFFQRRILDQ